jgi:hypothetical protein
VKYPAFRSRGQEIQVGDLVCREPLIEQPVAPSMGLVCRIVNEDLVEVLLGSGLYITTKKELEVISETR